MEPQNKQLKQFKDGSYIQIKMVTPRKNKSNHKTKTESKKESLMSTQIRGKLTFKFAINILTVHIFGSDIDLANKFAPILKQISSDSSSLSGMMKSIQKGKGKDVSPSDSTCINKEKYKGSSNSKEAFKSARTPYLQFHYHSEALIREGTKAYMKKKYYKDMVSSRINTKVNKHSVYDRCCTCCHNEVKFKKIDEE